jgi:hypothetical protein
MPLNAKGRPCSTFGKAFVLAVMGVARVFQGLRAGVQGVAGVFQGLRAGV